MKKYLLFIFSCCALILGAQQSYEPGVIIDSISVVGTSDETFALYLPTGYKSDELSPILFVFSPSGNGRNGVEVFKEAAEDYSYILVSSNNARNGPYDRNFAIAERLFNHIYSNFNIKEKGIYLAGFSGGSRLVTAIASLTGQIEGVMACGAGFSYIPSHVPSIYKFAYAGICGERDMNYQEMVDVKGYLNRLQLDNTLFTFDGNHRWPPPAQILKAIDWLEMKSIKNGNLQRPKAEIFKSYRKNYDFAKTVDSEKQPLLAYEHYERLLGSYKRFFTLDSIVHTMRTIQKSIPYTKELELRKAVFEKERELAHVFISRFNKDYENPEKVTMKWWVKEFKKLDKLKEDSTDGQMEKMLSRFRFKLYAMVYEKQQLGGAAPSPAQKAFCKELYVMLYPKR